MKYLNIEYEVKHMPPLDCDFIPFEKWTAAYLEGAKQPVALAVEGTGGRISVYRTRIYGTDAFAEADFRYLERTVKFLLWSVGGFRIFICGCDELAQKIRACYSPGGVRDFDCDFMYTVYGEPLEVVTLPYEECPMANEKAEAVGKHLTGCRIGFDAGGSDRKVSAVIDGQAVYSEEVIWNPKQQEDAAYHAREIRKALRSAAEKMPHVDAIGVSTAGVVVKNRPMVSSLFIRVPKEQAQQTHEIYIQAAEEYGVPLAVANDGDVSALAGAMSLGVGELLGLAMGTSEAAGYVDAEGNILGWLNELAFAPVDLNEAATRDEWSGDMGVGCKYFSQDAAIKLAPAAGIALSLSLSLAEKLRALQELCESGQSMAAAIFESIGCYLAHALAFYTRFYRIGHVLLLGRVTSGRGGELILHTCHRVLQEEYPEVAANCTVLLPDEKARRIGQSVAAASLPRVE